MSHKVCLVVSDDLARYGFPGGHPFGADRQAAFLSEARSRQLDARAEVIGSRPATRAEIERFHTSDYVDRVLVKSQQGVGYLDYGDTPAYPGVYEASSHVVGAALTALDAVMAGECRRTFQPIGGLHHARRDRAAGFCVFNDVGVVIDTLRSKYGVARIAYVDIDVHHGDGLYYPYESDPDLIFADVHEDGDFLYPGTGRAHEKGKGAAAGTKLNIPMAPGASDADFMQAWKEVEAHVVKFKPNFFLLQCGADSLAGDPIAHLRYSAAAHGHAARRMCVLADEYAGGRLMATGGGGYNRKNIGLAWSAVLEALIEAP